jgi:hypothetical protein
MPNVQRVVRRQFDAKVVTKLRAAGTVILVGTAPTISSFA